MVTLLFVVVMNVITPIYGCLGFVLTLKHRRAGVYPAVKFMGLACDCLAVFRRSVCLSGRCYFQLTGEADFELKLLLSLMYTVYIVYTAWFMKTTIVPLSF